MFTLVAAVVAAVGAVGAALYYQSRQEVDFDINEGIEPAIDEPIAMHEMRRDPSRVERLRGKVSLVAFNDEVDEYKGISTAESWVVDTHGATIVVETTFEGPDAPSTANKSRGGAIKQYDNMKKVAQRNVRIEENARWLAKMLDVPFEA